MIEFVVLYSLPSGWWTIHRTSSRVEADAVAAWGETKRGWPHRVTVVP